MSKLKGLDILLNVIKEHNLTAYEIAKGTGLSSNGVQKILNGETKKPTGDTIDKIRIFIEAAITGTNIKTKNEVSETSYTDAPIYKDYVNELRKNAILEGEIIRLKELLDQHGIKH